MGHNIPNDNNIWRNCRVDNNGRIFDSTNRTGYGWYIGGSYNTIENCEIDHQGAWAIHNFSLDAHPTNNTYRNNIFHNNGDLPGANGGGGMLLASGGSNHQVYGNVFWGHWDSPIQLHAVNGTLIYNNTMYQNSLNGNTYPAINVLDVGVKPTNTVIKNNLLYKNGSGNIQDQGIGTVLSNNLCDFSWSNVGCDLTPTLNQATNPPNFVNEANFDFHLQSSSPAIGRGTATIAPSVTITNYSGTALDCGAF